MYRDSYYGLLRLPLDATAEQIRAKAGHLEQILVDLACAGDVPAVLKLREIRAARTVLCHPDARATYDRAYVAAITAHLRYVPPRPADDAGRTRARPSSETWLVFNAEDGGVQVGRAILAEALHRLRRAAHVLAGHERAAGR